MGEARQSERVPDLVEKHTTPNSAYEFDGKERKENEAPTAERGSEDTTTTTHEAPATGPALPLIEPEVQSDDDLREQGPRERRQKLTPTLDWQR